MPRRTEEGELGWASQWACLCCWELCLPCPCPQRLSPALCHVFLPVVTQSWQHHQDKDVSGTTPRGNLLRAVRCHLWGSLIDTLICNDKGTAGWQSDLYTSEGPWRPGTITWSKAFHPLSHGTWKRKCLYYTLQQTAGDLGFSTGLRKKSFHFLYIIWRKKIKCSVLGMITYIELGYKIFLVAMRNLSGLPSMKLFHIMVLWSGTYRAWPRHSSWWSLQILGGHPG